MAEGEPMEPAGGGRQEGQVSQTPRYKAWPPGGMVATGRVCGKGLTLDMLDVGCPSDSHT